MDNLKQDVMTKGLPWGRDVKWPVVAIEAVILIGVGIYMLIDQDSASKVVLQLIGVVLLATSLIVGLASYRNPDASLGFFDAYRAGVGSACGAIATVSWWSEYIADSAVRDILGWGLIAYSVLHVVGIVLVRGRAGLRLSTILVVGFTLVLGIVLLTGSSDNVSDRLTALGITLLAFGVLLGALAYYLYSRAKDVTAAPVAS